MRALDKKRAKPRKDGGGEFFLIDRAQWKAVADTQDLNLMSTFLVLQSGTARDRVTTGWSAQSVEKYTGMRKPAAQLRINRLKEMGLLRNAEAWTHRKPAYAFTEVDETTEPIFLPNALVTGLATETPALARVRETRDPLLLRLLIDLYGAVERDLTWGVSVAMLSNKIDPANQPKLIIVNGALAVWGVDIEAAQTTVMAGDLHIPHSPPELPGEASGVWDRLRVLEDIGLVYSQNWIFTGPQKHDDDPIMPLDHGPNEDKVSILSDAATTLAYMLLEQVAEHLNHQADDQCVFVLPAHSAPPAWRKVYRLRVEPNTPERRRAYARVMEQVEGLTRDYATAANRLRLGDRPRPIRTHHIA